MLRLLRAGADPRARAGLRVLDRALVQIPSPPPPPNTFNKATLPRRGRRFSRRKAGRKDIRYSRYKPLASSDDPEPPGIDDLLAEVDTSGPADADADRGTWLFKQWFQKK